MTTEHTKAPARRWRIIGPGIVVAAAVVVPDLPDMATGLVPTVPDGGLLYTLGLIGGVGGTITMAA